MERTVQCWKARAFVPCHPDPGPCLDHEKFDPANGVIISLRDPIDRFVSSFYWRLHITCGKNDTRQINNGATRDTQKYCKRPNPGEGWIFIQYNGNASLFAESLCSSNATLRQEAREGIQRIQHANMALHKFLNFTWKPQHLFPIVTERGVADLESQIDASLQWLYDRDPFEDADSFQNRTSYARRRRVAGSLTHSSGRDKKALLSLQAQQCLAEYYRKDYELLQTLSDKGVCKTEDCNRGLRSILERRKSLLVDGKPVVISTTKL